MPQTTILLGADDDLAGFKAAVRRLVAAQVAPQDVDWQVAQAQDLFSAPWGDAAAAGPSALAGTATGEAGSRDGVRGAWNGGGSGATCEVDAEGAAENAEGVESAEIATPAPVLRLPADWVTLLGQAALHRDPGRFALLYRLVWRLRAEPGLRDDPLDADRLQAERMARAVRRCQHKMTAFVRFRPLPNGRHMAWFEPEHHTLRATAPFFVRRFAQMDWAILTPERSVRWDGQALQVGPGARREALPAADAGEQLWLTYYANIFNPARLKPAMMQKEMPRRYWKNLPEAALIAPLMQAAAERSGRMVEDAASDPHHRRPGASIALRLDQRPAVQAPPGTLAALRLATERCRACPLGDLATQAVHGEGARDAPLMLVGEQPGDQEDLQGRPFVGPAGRLLQRAFDRLGWPRESVYLTNAVRHFKHELRGKRRIHKTPGQQEILACAHWLEEEIALVAPRAAIALGATAARSLLGRQVAVTSVRGQWLQRADGLPVLVTLHPAALLRMEAADPESLFDGWVADLAQAASIAGAVSAAVSRADDRAILPPA